MRVPLRVGALGALKSRFANLQSKFPTSVDFRFPKSAGRLVEKLKGGTALQAAGIAGSVALVAATGMASALFVDYLADRAVARTGGLPGIEAVAATPVAEASPVQARIPTDPAGADAPAAPLPVIDETPTRTVAAPAEPLPAIDKTAPAAASAEAGAPDRTFTAAIAPRRAPDATRPVQPPSTEGSPDAGMGDQAAVDIEAPDNAGSVFDEGDGMGEQAAIATSESADAAEPEGSTRAAKVTADVNLRAEPNDESSVLTVVPTRNTVQVVNCDGWCEVEFEGKKGFIYKSFIEG